MSQPSSLLRIEVTNTQRKVRLDLPDLQRFGKLALCEAMQAFPKRRVKLQNVAEISAVLVSDRRIARLHREFMQINSPTDVITFQHGEIFISVETARENAKRYHTTTAAEVQLYIVHGILHLLGFDDTTSRAADLMETAQARVFKGAMKASEAQSRPPSV